MSKLLINEPPLQVLPSLAKAIGLNEAIFLQQVHYWLQGTKHRHEGKPWVYNTYEGWQEQFPFWSVSTIRRTVASLCKQGLIHTTSEYNKVGIDNTLWYTVDYDCLLILESRLLNLNTPSVQNEQTMCSEWTDHEVNLNTPIPETTTETTQKSTSLDVAPAAHTPQQEMFGAICEAIGWDHHVITDRNKAQVAQAVKALTKANYTVGDIRRFMVEVWFKDWRWEKKRSYPSLAQLREEIGKIRGTVPAAAPKSKSIENFNRLAANIGVTK